MCIFYLLTEREREQGKMTTKLRKWGGAAASPLEETVSQIVFGLEANEREEALAGLFFIKAKEVEVPEQGASAVVVMVPKHQLKAWQRLHVRVVSELEKKLCKQVFLIADRKIMKKPKSEKIKRPRARTLTAVHEAALNDICFPDDIVGQRTRVSINGKRLLKVYLSAKDKATTKPRLPALQAVYKKLTGKDAAFEFPTFHC